jgi:hypothetical protein
MRLAAFRAPAHGHMFENRYSLEPCNDVHHGDHQTFDEAHHLHCQSLSPDIVSRGLRQYSSPNMILRIAIYLIDVLLSQHNDISGSQPQLPRAVDSSHRRINNPRCFHVHHDIRVQVHILIHIVLRFRFHRHVQIHVHLRVHPHVHLYAHACFHVNVQLLAILVVMTLIQTVSMRMFRFLRWFCPFFALWDIVVCSLPRRSRAQIQSV